MAVGWVCSLYPGDFGMMRTLGARAVVVATVARGGGKIFSPFGSGLGSCTQGKVLSTAPFNPTSVPPSNASRATCLYRASNARQVASSTPTRAWLLARHRYISTRSPRHLRPTLSRLAPPHVASTVHDAAKPLRRTDRRASRSLRPPLDRHRLHGRCPARMHSIARSHRPSTQ